MHRYIIHSWFQTKSISYLIYSIVDQIFIKFKFINKKKMCVSNDVWCQKHFFGSFSDFVCISTVLVSFLQERVPFRVVSACCFVVQDLVWSCYSFLFAFAVACRSAILVFFWKALLWLSMLKRSLQSSLCLTMSSFWYYNYTNVFFLFLT